MVDSQIVTLIPVIIQQSLITTIRKNYESSISIVIVDRAFAISNLKGIVPERINFRNPMAFEHDDQY